MDFRIIGLDLAQFRPLFGLSESDLWRHDARRVVADDSKPGYPCRVSLEEAAPGEPLLLVNYEHHGVPTPYRSRHAIFVRESVHPRFDRVGLVPDLMRTRLLSIRAFDRDGMMIDADVVDGREAEKLIERLFENRDASCLHAHFAKRGCYAARIERS